MTKEEIASARLRTAFDLFTAGERMMRQNLQRRHPEMAHAAPWRGIRRWCREAGHVAAEGFASQVSDREAEALILAVQARGYPGSATSCRTLKT